MKTKLTFLTLLLTLFFSLFALSETVLAQTSQETSSSPVPAESRDRDDDDEEDEDDDEDDDRSNIYFNLAVCYEGAVGEQSTAARFGYLARDMGNNANVQRNTVTNGGAQPQGISLGQNSERTWSTNTYALNSNNYVWTVRIDGKTKTATIDRLNGSNSLVTAQNSCPGGSSNENEPGTDIPEVSYPVLFTIIGGGIIGGLFIGYLAGEKRKHA